jgi:hypothetical protein
MATEQQFESLVQFLQRVPAVQPSLRAGLLDGPGWYVKFALDLHHPLAWHVVQELGHVLNYLSPTERLPTVFMPVSPPPYLNGGPTDFLSWVIECRNVAFTPALAAEWLEGRLPRPVDDEANWHLDESEAESTT